ncbi:MAG TPA: lamin tail domain-containing protein [Acidobacteriota bacterium]|nr:lamin tail domain-containing protein [Acidobacteriota bacterium]
MVRSWGWVVWIVVFAAALAVTMKFVPPARAQTAGGLVLNEILAGPARDWDGDGLFDSRGDEWLEVRNAGAAAVDLAAYRVADADSTIRVGLTGLLMPGDVALVTGTFAVAWQRALGRPVTGLSLNNAGDTVFLFRVTEADTIVADQKTYNSIEGATDRATGRFGDGWALFDALNKYTGSGEPKGTGCPPTPAGANGCTTPVSQTSWGWIKDAYR